MRTDDLHSLVDDMTAFIMGHGMRRFYGYVGDEISSILWNDDGNPESWKDFVELAKSTAAPFVTMDEVRLTKEDLDFVIDRLRDGDYSDALDDARWLRTYVGKTGFVQLGFAYQGTVFLYEVSTEWYERYQHILDSAEAIDTLLLEDDEDDE
jgi:hypothetical protein